MGTHRRSSSRPTRRSHRRERQPGPADTTGVPTPASTPTSIRPPLTSAEAWPESSPRRGNSSRATSSAFRFPMRRMARAPRNAARVPALQQSPRRQSSLHDEHGRARRHGGERLRGRRIWPELSRVLLAAPLGERVLADAGARDADRDHHRGARLDGRLHFRRHRHAVGSAALASGPGSRRRNERVRHDVHPYVYCVGHLRGPLHCHGQRGQVAIATQSVVANVAGARPRPAPHLQPQRSRSPPRDVPPTPSASARRPSRPPGLPSPPTPGTSATATRRQRPPRRTPMPTQAPSPPGRGQGFGRPDRHGRRDCHRDQDAAGVHRPVASGAAGQVDEVQHELCRGERRSTNPGTTFAWMLGAMSRTDCPGAASWQRSTRCPSVAQVDAEHRRWRSTIERRLHAPSQRSRLGRNGRQGRRWCGVNYFDPDTGQSVAHPMTGPCRVRSPR